LRISGKQAVNVVNKGILVADKILPSGGDPFALWAARSRRRSAAVAYRTSSHSQEVMLSPALSQLLERARTRFGLEVEILDATLAHVYPESGTELGRLIEESPVVRRTLLDALAAGRPEQVDRSGLTYQVFPLRRSPKTRHTQGLLAVRRTGAPAGADAESWSDLARAIVEADFAAAETLSDERQRSRRVLAALRFVRHLVETDVESELAQAIVQAAAVWFDVDARIYERDLAGDFVLHTSLPAAHIDEAGKRLNSLWLAGVGEMRRIGTIPEWGVQGGGSAEVALVPLAASDGAEWVLVLVGSVAEDADAILPVLGRIAGVQLDSLRARRRERAREVFESRLSQIDVAAELLVVHAVRELVQMTGAASAALTLNRRGRLRRFVRVGTFSPEPVALAASAGESLFAADQFVCALPIASGVSATLELRPATGDSFTPDAALVTRVAARVLQTWLVGAEPSLREQPVSVDTLQPVVSAFVRRIEEELERAKRFDLRLSLVVIDVPRQVAQEQDTVSQLQETVRRELRGSDVLGKMNGHRVAALLTHTDAPGSHRVVGRLRRRLADAAARFNLSGVTLGHAVFSPDCRTAEALVSQAVRDAEPIAAA
jgi:GGDEF domain-containing protein